MNSITIITGPILLSIAIVSGLFAENAYGEGDRQRGAQQFRQCVACHSMVPGEHLTGPSLAGVVGREAASVEGFDRYSGALRESGILWTEEALDKWLQDPTGLIPETSMRIRGIADKTVREDIIAFLGTADQAGGIAESNAGGSAGMMGGMGGPRLMSLKELAANQQVRSIRYCGDAYYVTLATGRTYTFWEFNLRFKSDSSQNGPPEGQVAIVPSGMQGDRASVIFADPGAISDFIRKEC